MAANDHAKREDGIRSQSSSPSISLYPVSPPPAASPGVHPLYGLPLTPPPVSPASVYSLDEKEETYLPETHWSWFITGALLGAVFGLFALLPICFLNKLKYDRAVRNSYLLGYIPGMIIAMVIYTMLAMFLTALVRVK